MISKTQRTKLKRVLKNSFITDVLKVLSDNKVVSKNGAPYEKTYISHVFNGRNENILIEDAILLVYETKKQEQSNLRVKRNELLGIKKPEAVTSGLNLK